MSKVIKLKDIRNDFDSCLEDLSSLCDNDINEVNNRIIEKLDSILKMLKGEQIEDGYMDITGVAQYTSCSKSTIRKACQEGRLKYNDSQGKHLYKKSDVEMFLNG